MRLRRLAALLKSRYNSANLIKLATQIFVGISLNLVRGGASPQQLKKHKSVDVYDIPDSQDTASGSDAHASFRELCLLSVGSSGTALRAKRVLLCIASKPRETALELRSRLMETDCNQVSLRSPLSHPRGVGSDT